MTRDKRPSEAGTVLLTTLLIMAVMAAITVALMDDIRVAVKRTINVNAYAQADWQARGAEEFIRAYLSTDFAALEEREKAFFLRAGEPVILPTDEGLISVRLKDASHCFNLNGVVAGDGSQNTGAIEFIELAEVLGVPRNQAEAISNALIDWIDADQNPRQGGAEDGTYLRVSPPYRTADTAMTGPEEMRALNGMDEELWEIFRPFVCTGQFGQLTPVNINTIELDRAAVLAAALGGPDGSTAAQRLLEERGVAGFEDEQALGAAIANLQIEDLGLTERVNTQVTSIFVEVVTTVGPAERVRTYRFDGVDSGELILTYRGWGRETFRPEIKTLLGNEDAR